MSPFAAMLVYGVPALLGLLALGWFYNDMADVDTTILLGVMVIMWPAVPVMVGTYLLLCSPVVLARAVRRRFL